LGKDKSTLDVSLELPALVQMPRDELAVLSGNPAYLPTVLGDQNYGRKRIEDVIGLAAKAEPCADRQVVRRVLVMRLSSQPKGERALKIVVDRPILR